MNKNFTLHIIVVFFAASTFFCHAMHAQQTIDKYLSLESGLCFERIPASVIGKIYAEQQSNFNQSPGISQSIHFSKIYLRNEYIGFKSGFGIAHYNYNQDIKNLWALNKHSFFISTPFEFLLKQNVGQGYVYLSSGISADLYALQYNHATQITTEGNIYSYLVEPYLFNFGAQNLRFNDVSPWKYFSMPLSFSYTASFGTKFRITENRFLGANLNFRLFELVSLYPSNSYTEKIYTSTGIEKTKTKWYPIHLTFSLSYYF
ncbi:MAG: hypothetical protein PHE56_14035 [Bacteroidales bacterium]|jgi:hypothetical protein|nr:hypothetical protein [Bacteroidales bacterium]